MSSSLVPVILIFTLVVLSGSASFALARRTRTRGASVIPVAEVFARIALLATMALLALLGGCT